MVLAGRTALRWVRLWSPRPAAGPLSLPSWWPAACERLYGSRGEEKIDMSMYPVESIRNFSIIAHVDHGKSTLADRLLEITGTIAKTDRNKQVLDKLQVERERGITVKAQSASLFYNHDGVNYLLNLIDTPGHVDFSYEVSRSLSACQGVILVVDANEGIQAQTVANFYLAFEAQLAIIPVINKIDLKNADPERVEKQIEKLFDIPVDECVRISAKQGTNVEKVLQKVIEKIPPPQCNTADPLKALVFDSTFDHYRGVIANIALFGGEIEKGHKIVSAHTKKRYEVNEVGILSPNEQPTHKLYAGQVGYLIAGMKEVTEAQIGDTLFLYKQPVEPLPGFKSAKPMVFAGMYPVDQTEYNNLKSALERLTLNDSSVNVHRDSSLALGAGWRLGFLGLLHMEVFNQRLEQEYNMSVILTAPTVPYKAVLSSAKLIKRDNSAPIGMLDCKKQVMKALAQELKTKLLSPLQPVRETEPKVLFRGECPHYQTAEFLEQIFCLQDQNGLRRKILALQARRMERWTQREYGKKEITIINPAQFPDKLSVSEYLEPTVLGTIVTPQEYIGKIIVLCQDRRAVQKDMLYIDEHRVMLKYLFPLNEIVVDFYDALKSLSSGYASFDYEDAGYQAADLIKMDILLNGNPVEELATIVHNDKAYATGKFLCERLKDAIPRQLFEIAIQAAIGKKIIARETLKAYRKNVVAKCYGGDITRRMKLLKRQAEGKKLMRKIGNVEVPRDAFIRVLKRQTDK